MPDVPAERRPGSPPRVIARRDERNEPARPAEPPGDFVSLFGVERTRLAELPGGLDRADWDESAGETEFVAWLDDLQAGWVRAARRFSPRLVTGLLHWAGPSWWRAPAEFQHLAVPGDSAVIGIVLQTRAITGTPT